MSNFKNLLVWQKSMELAKDIYTLVKQLPKEETYSLSDQMRRAVISIPSNIAEGKARNTEKSFYHFLSIASGSCAELQTQLLLCVSIGYLSEQQIQPALSRCEEVSKMLSRLKNSCGEYTGS